MSLRSLMIFLVGLLALAMLAFICLGYHAPTIEQDLVDRTRAALAAKGIGWAEVSGDGQNIILTGKPPSPAEQLKAEKVANGVWGVETVAIDLTDGVAEVAPYEFGLEFADGTVTLLGSIPDETTLAGIKALVSGSITEGRQVVDKLEIREDAPRGFVDMLLHHIVPSLVDFEYATVTFEHNVFKVDGQASSELKRYDIERRLRNAGVQDLGVELAVSAPRYGDADSPVQSSLTSIAPGLEPPPAQPITGEAISAPAEPSQTLEPDVCERRFADLLTDNRVHFDFKDEAITDDGEAMLEDVTELIQQCPRIQLEIGGHTDWKGPGEVNERLSLRRAKAVREYLIELGVSPEQLTAKGYGESEPVADNTTEEGRAINRRVEITVLDQ